MAGSYHTRRKLMFEDFFEHQAYSIQRASLDDAWIFGDITKEQYQEWSNKLDAKYKKQLRFKDNGKTN